MVTEASGPEENPLNILQPEVHRISSAHEIPSVVPAVLPAFTKLLGTLALAFQFCLSQRILFSFELHDERNGAPHNGLIARVHVFEVRS